MNGRAEVPNQSDFKTPANLAIADQTPERKFLRELCSRDNSKAVDGWLKNTPVGFYPIEYAWKKGEHPKRGEFSPDFFIKIGTQVFVVEIKGDEEIADPGADNMKKHEYATAHFAAQRLAGTRWSASLLPVQHAYPQGLRQVFHETSAG